MRLFKIILVIFAVYFIRRFWQLYKAMEKRGQEIRAREEEIRKSAPVSDGNTVDAEFKIIDR